MTPENRAIIAKLRDMEGAADTFRQTLSDKNVRRRVQIVKLLKVDIDKASAACQQWLEEMGETPDEPS